MMKATHVAKRRIGTDDTTIAKRGQRLVCRRTRKGLHIEWVEVEGSIFTLARTGRRRWMVRPEIKRFYVDPSFVKEVEP